MKLYMWVNPYPVWYGQSTLVVVAESVESAKAQALTGKMLCDGGETATSTVARDKVDLGDPDIVMDLPCAFWNEWSE